MPARRNISFLPMRGIISPGRKRTLCREGGDIHSPTFKNILKAATCLLICKVTVGVLLTYGDYIPPSFESVFLQDREHYFWDGYSWAFYTHIASGPCALILGLILLSGQFRRRYSNWHRALGRVQVLCVVFLVTPSGIWMARYAESGNIAGLGFATLAVATGLCAALGWRSAVDRKFVSHRRWMWRCYVLLCSAVVLRLQAGLATVVDFDAPWLYPQAAWTSWLVPMMILELIRLRKRPTTDLRH